MDGLEKSDKLVRAEDQLTVRVVTDHKYGEEVGYQVGYELTDMDGKIYPITSRERQVIIGIMNDPTAKVIQLGNTILAVHQVRHIKQFKSYFGPRAGEA